MLGPAEVGDILLAQTNSKGAQGWLGRLCLSPRGAYHLHSLQRKKEKKKKKNDQYELKSASTEQRT